MVTTTAIHRSPCAIPNQILHESDRCTHLASTKSVISLWGVAVFATNRKGGIVVFDFDDPSLLALAQCEELVVQVHTRRQLWSGVVQYWVSTISISGRVGIYGLQYSF